MFTLNLFSHVQVLAQSLIRFSSLHHPLILLQFYMALVIAVPDHPLQTFLSLLLKIESLIHTLKHIQLLIEEAGDDFEDDPVPFIDYHLFRAHQTIRLALKLLQLERARRLRQFRRMLIQFLMIHGHLPLLPNRISFLVPNPTVGVHQPNSEFPTCVQKGFLHQQLWHASLISCESLHCKKNHPTVTMQICFC